MTSASAAIPWKHPVFSGTAGDRSVMPEVRLSDDHARFDPRKRQVVASGKLTSDTPAHSVVNIDDMNKKPGP